MVLSIVPLSKTLFLAAFDPPRGIKPIFFYPFRLYIFVSLNLQLYNSIGWSLSLYILSTSINFPFISSAAISLVDLFRLRIFQRQLDFLQFAALCNSIGWSLSFVYFLTSVGFRCVSCRACNSIGQPLSLVYCFMFYLQLCNSIGWSLFLFIFQRHWVGCPLMYCNSTIPLVDLFLLFIF